MRDISERKAHTEALAHQAMHDGLTGLANRALFTEHLSQSLAAATRNHESRAVLVMDLDGFKWVNDTFGHDQGDCLLEQVAGRLVAATREADTIARLGGDEFAILPGDAADLPAAAALVWNSNTCSRPFELDRQAARVSASIGIAMFPEHGVTPAELLRRADVAMYEAKRSGSGHAIADNAQEELAHRQLELLLELRKCVSRGELILHYQPKIQLGTGVSAESKHSFAGSIRPGACCCRGCSWADVERTELLGPLTQWVLNEALRQQREWDDGGIDLTMAVNISAYSLTARSTLLGTLEQAHKTWETKPDRLILELTESALIESEAPRLLGRIHDMGIKLSIDDFGTGYSSLSYLQRLPVDEIKIDKSFVTRLANRDEDDDDPVIVRSTIELAHNLGLAVVAEGVEDDVALDMLGRYGCDRAQGYFLGRPRPAEELTSRLTAPQAAASDAGGAPDAATVAGSARLMDGEIQALSDCQAAAQAVLDTVADGILTTDETGVIESINRSAQNLFRYRDDEALGHRIDRLIAAVTPTNHGPGDRAAVSGHIRSATGRDRNGRVPPGRLQVVLEVEHRQLKVGDRRSP